MKQRITIDNIFNGWQQLDYFNRDGQFLNSIAIDPDMPAIDSGTKASGLIRPTAMEKFSGTEITGVPLWFITNPKTSNIYLYANDGKVHTINSDLTMGTALNSGDALTTASGNGAEYYDNFIYFARNSDIARYGPLNGTPALTESYWNTTLSLTALNNITYPTINGIKIPNHTMKYCENANRLYFADVNSSNQGIISYIKTTRSTYEGDTADGSTYENFTLGYGEYITTLEEYGTDLVIGYIEGINTSVMQAPAQIAFWDRISTSFNFVIKLKDPLITALKNVNGSLYIFSGYATGGCRISVYIGGEILQELAWIPDIYPPISQGAVDAILNRLVFGSNTIEPEVSGSVFAFGAKESSIQMGLHNILRATCAGNNPYITAVKYVDQTSGALIQPIIGWKDDASKGLDKLSTTYGDYNVWRSQRYRIGEKFNINKIKIPLAQAIGNNMAFTIKIISNNGNDTDTVATINNTNNSDEVILRIDTNQEYTNDFYLQLEWTGTALCTINLPITIDIDIHENN